ncbi:MAG TPA: MFS transporter [Mesorhizobium sp.]|jgi:MFS family permease|nr:MFS transporter [Mesorhizobium sp.]
MSGDRLRLLLLALLLLSGVMAGAQLGKIAPLVPWLQAEGGFSLAGAGWLASLIGLFVALAALPAGWAIARWGARPSFLLGGVLQFGGALMLALFAGGAGGAWGALGPRLVEGLGYLVLVIATPALLAQLAKPAWRAAALALWGGFVPLGFATADFLALALLPSPGPQAFLLVVALLFGLFASLALILLRHVRDAEAPGSSDAATGSGKALGLPAWSLAASFGAYVVSSVAFFAFLPTFVGRAGSDVALAAGAVALTVPLGNVLAGVLLQGRGARSAAWLALAGLIMGAIGAAAAFHASGEAATASLIVTAAAGGLAVSALFAAIPAAAGLGSTALVLGLVAQAGGVGTVIGPPLGGWTVETGGWPLFGWFLAGFGVLGAAALFPLLRRPKGLVATGR